MAELLARVIPGRADTAARLRSAIVSFCANPLAKSIHLSGPIGAGKSTTARALALAKRLAPMRSAEAKALLGDIRFEAAGLIDYRFIGDWYVELSLTGLVETVAGAQLFGVAQKAITDVAASPGIFERASQGGSAGARVTGGVVFLDEIGDLPQSLQTRLLPVLSGGAFYRIGAEGGSARPLVYRGVTITASWKPLASPPLRADLLSRISDYVVSVPSLRDRDEDFSVIVETIHAHLVRDLKTRVEEICVDKDTDREFLERHLAEAGHLDQALVSRLRAVKWSEHGNMRGLVRALERIVLGREDPERVIAGLPKVRQESPAFADSSGLVEFLLGAEGSGRETLGEAVAEFEGRNRQDLHERIRNDASVVSRLADRFGIPAEDLRTRVRNLARDRRRESKGGGDD